MSFYDKDKKVRLRLCLDPKERFPEKLFDVANDNFLIKWDKSGESVIVVDADTFEANVMKCYPGFLQISSFNNLRRLFREYGFDWKINADETMEFSNDFFVRSQPYLLDEIVTRRKSFTRPSPSQQSARLKLQSPQHTSTPVGKRRSSLRRSVLGTGRGLSPRSLSPEKDSRHNTSSEQIHVNEPSCEQTINANPRNRKLDPAILDTYARNELTEDEILTLLLRRDSILERLEGPGDESYLPRPGSEWLFMFSDIKDYPVWSNLGYHDTFDWEPNVCPATETDQMAVGIVQSDITPLSPVTVINKITTSSCCPCRCHYETKTCSSIK